MTMNFLTWMLIGCLGLVTSTAASPRPLENARLPSPDQKLIAQIHSTTNQFAEDTVEILSPELGTLLSFPMRSAAGGNGRYVLRIEWTADSKFLVFSTFSSGAHSSWNFKTFVYSRPLNQVLSIDELLRPVVDPNFVLPSQDKLEVKTLNVKGIDAEPIKLSIDLNTLLPRT